MRMRYRGTANARRLVSPRTDIVIEGFPRCANSFAVRAFRMDNDPGGTLRIATHFHTPAQVRLGVRWHRPVLVLTRRPEDAVVSFPALAMQLDKHGFAAASDDVLRRQVRYWTRRYARFHERLLPVLDRVIVADFPETTSDFGAVVRRVNERFGTGFVPFDHTEENVKAILGSAKVHLGPSEERDAIKARFAGFYHSKNNEASRRNAVRTRHLLLESGKCAFIRS